jgi:hypothetical protein
MITALSFDGEETGSARRAESATGSHAELAMNPALRLPLPNGIVAVAVTSAMAASGLTALSALPLFF